MFCKKAKTFKNRKKINIKFMKNPFAIVYIFDIMSIVKDTKGSDEIAEYSSKVS